MQRQPQVRSCGDSAERLSSDAFILYREACACTQKQDLHSQRAGDSKCKTRSIQFTADLRQQLYGLQGSEGVGWWNWAPHSGMPNCVSVPCPRCRKRCLVRASVGRGGLWRDLKRQLVFVQDVVSEI